MNIQNTELLNQAEQEVVSINLAELILEPITGKFDLAHLSAIHKALFADIYPWAGQVRTTEISKGGQLFLPYQLIEKVASEIFSELHDESLLANLTEQNFVCRAAYYLGRINTMHAFREGNGRTQRLFLDQLVALHGYAFEWSAVSGEQMAQACLAARQKEPDFQPLTKLLRLHIKIKP
ncbi:MAG: Fic family protein [Pseudomonas sp.]|nr:Fic family protein [Pseudomonas sp.]